MRLFFSRTIYLQRQQPLPIQRVAVRRRIIQRDHALPVLAGVVAERALLGEAPLVDGGADAVAQSAAPVGLAEQLLVEPEVAHAGHLAGEEGAAGRLLLRAQNRLLLVGASHLELGSRKQRSALLNAHN